MRWIRGDVSAHEIQRHKTEWHTEYASNGVPLNVIYRAEDKNWFILYSQENYVMGPFKNAVDAKSYFALSYDDEYHIENKINLNMHRPNYALIYNNIIEDSIVDNSYYKILKTIYFEDSNTKWKIISSKNDEYIKLKKRTRFI